MYGQGLLARYYLYTREVLGGQQRICRGLNRRGRVCLPDERLACHSIFAMSLARSFHSDPHGMIFIHASCDQPLMNSPITELSFVILTIGRI